MFSNLSITPPRKFKPHICVREGWWRVSPFRGLEWGKSWDVAHAFAQYHNNKRRHKNGTDDTGTNVGHVH